MNYVIAIPSFRRSKILNTKTLTTLYREGIDKEHIFIFVEESEISDYQTALNENYYNKIVTGGKGLIKQHEAIEAFFPEGTHIVRIDDDIDKINMTLSCFNGIKLHDFLQLAFHLCIENNAFLWGLYPVNNPFFIIDKPEVNFNLSYICGNFFGFIKRNNEQLKLITTVKTNANKEDVERTLRYWKCDGIIVRFDRIITQTKYYGTDGGGLGRFNDRLEPMRIATDELLTEFPEYGKKYIKATGMTEFKFKKIENRHGAKNIFSYVNVNE